MSQHGIRSSMDLAVYTPCSPDARYFTQHALATLEQYDVALFGELSAIHPLANIASRAAGQRLVVHHLLDATEVRVERVRLGAIPGITIVHDIFLRTHGPEAIINSGFEDTVKLLHATIDRFPERDKEYSRERYFAIRELSLSLLPVFTDAVMHREYLECFRTRGAQSLAVGSAYVPWPAALPAQANRRRHSVPTNANPWRVGFVGDARLSARAHALFSAVAALANPQLLSIVWMVASEQDLVAVREFVKDWPTVRVQFVVGRTPERWLEMLPTLDLAAHLHFGMFERTGPYLPLSLGSGVPCLVSDECCEWLPAAAAVFIRPGASEVGELTIALQELLAGGVLDCEAAIEYVRATHDPRIVSLEFQTLLQMHESALRARMQQMRDLQRRSAAALLEEISSPPQIAAVFQELGWSAQSQENSK